MFQVVKQVEVVKEVVLPEAEWLSYKHEPQKPGTVFSRKRDSKRREIGLVLFVYSLSAITQTNKQGSNV